MRIIAGLIASLVATLAVSVFPLLGPLMGKVVSANAQAAFTQIGFAIVAAVAFGVAFPLLYKLLPGKSDMAKGSYFGLLVWTATIVLVPMTGAYGLTLGLEAPLATLMLYVVYGLLLGIGFQDLSRELIEIDAGPQRKSSQASR